MLPGVRRLACWNNGSSVADALPQGPVKLVILPRTRDGLGRDGLRRHLETVHGPMVVREPDVSGGFITYVHHYALGLDAGTQVLDDRDAVTIIRFAEFADLVASKSARAYREVVGPDEDNFREIEGSVALFVREIDVLAGADDAPRKLFVFRAVQAVSDDALRLWSDTLRDNALAWGIAGAITNVVRSAEGHFPYCQFDEIGLHANANAALVVDQLMREAGRVFGSIPTCCMLTEPVRFL